MTIRICALAILLCTLAAGGDSFAWRQGESSLALLNGERVVWQFNYGKDLPKPYFFPVCLPDGTELTALGPSDHRWHYALWFSWKELNQANYWDRSDKTKLAGATDVLTARAEPKRDHSARIRLTLNYHPDSGPSVLSETRTIRVTPPAKDGSYYIDWLAVFTAGPAPVVMKGGTSGGGYAGMSVRIAQNSRDWRLANSEGLEDTAGGSLARNTHGKRARWADFSLVDKATGKTAGIAILEHPESFRHPAQWHNIIDEKKPFGYFSPAPLWSEPYTLPAGKSLTVHYRILIHPGRTGKLAIDREWKKFSRLRGAQ
jgi:hypothetical protein